MPIFREESFCVWFLASAAPWCSDAFLRAGPPRWPPPPAASLPTPWRPLAEAPRYVARGSSKGGSLLDGGFWPDLVLEFGGSCPPWPAWAVESGPFWLGSMGDLLDNSTKDWDAFAGATLLIEELAGPLQFCAC